MTKKIEYVRVKVLSPQTNPFSWCNEHLGKIFTCYWFAMWGCWRIKDYGGYWDDCFREGYENFEIIEKEKQ